MFCMWRKIMFCQTRKRWVPFLSLLQFIINVLCWCLCALLGLFAFIAASGNLTIQSCYIWLSILMPQKFRYWHFQIKIWFCKKSLCSTHVLKKTNVFKSKVKNKSNLALLKLLEPIKQRSFKSFALYIKGMFCLFRGMFVKFVRV